jgi:hypothetical protein
MDIRFTVVLHPRLCPSVVACTPTRLQNLQENSVQPICPVQGHPLHPRTRIHLLDPRLRLRLRARDRQDGDPVRLRAPWNQYGAERFICRAGLADAGQGEWDPNQRWCTMTS